MIKKKNPRKLNRICKIDSNWSIFSLHCHTILQPEKKSKCPGLKFGNSIADSLLCFGRPVEQYLRTEHVKILKCHSLSHSLNDGVFDFCITLTYGLTIG